MMPSPFSVEGKLVLVTGAGTGIGQGIARVLARLGADVALHYRGSADGAQAAVQEITALGRRAIAIQGDLGQVADCRRVVDEAATFLGGLDALINNAGTTATAAFVDISEHQYNTLFNVNIRGQFFCAQQAVPHLLARGRALAASRPGWTWPGGSIVNVSSVHGAMGCPGYTAYAGTKGAINAFTRALAVELLPQHIRANVIAPGTIEVPNYFKRYAGYTRAAGNAGVPWGRVGEPEEVGTLAAYLVSDASEFMTGSVLFFDGGLTAVMHLTGDTSSSDF